MTSQPSTASSQRLLAARQATYSLLVRLYLAEPDAALASHLRGRPGFTDFLPEEAHLAAWLEEEAIEYQWLFGMNVYPYESIFIDRELMLNTQAADRVAALYSECGFDPHSSSFNNSDPPDHLGLEFALMRHLLAVERHANASGDTAQAHQARRHRSRFLHEHMALWAPILALTLDRIARRPLHHLLANLTLEMVMKEVVLGEGSGERTMDDGRWTMGVGGPVSLPPSSASGSDTQPPTLDEQSINSVVRQLITPAEVGVFISRADINALAGSLELPVQMGDRFQMLRGLFEAAGQFDLLLSLLDALDALFAGSRDSLAQLAADYPAWAPYALPWQERVSTGRTLVSDLQAQVRAGL